jgi:hypothetical protein
VIRSNPGDSFYENQGDQSFEGDQEMGKVNMRVHDGDVNERRTM